MTKKTRTPKTAERSVLDNVRVKTGKRSRRLNQKEQDALIQLFAIKAPDPTVFDVLSLAPEGSILRKVLRHFRQTDISYALPLFQTAMIAASWLTQSGAHLLVPGIGPILPTLWTIGLAESGSAKTLAAEEVTTIFSSEDAAPVAMLPLGASDAQWIMDLAENNGGFWLQDEVGKFFNAVLTQKTYARIKPWMLSAYSHQPISNRLKGEKEKLTIERPFFTFHGLSVFSTWKDDIDATSMLDGFCQRENYYVAEKRTDTDMYDHFLYFAGEGTEAVRQDIRDNWNALCAQPGAADPYTLNPHVVPFLEAWWRGLRDTWGQSALPASFIRRTGFSVLRYLMVLQFLLGKSKAPIDLETAELATRYAEYHLESALAVIQDYDRAGVGRVQKIAELRGRLMAENKPATQREVSRRLSKSQRRNFPPELIRTVLQVLENVDKMPGLIDAARADAHEKSHALIGERDKIRTRLVLNERKRNERRLRELRKALAAAPMDAQDPAASCDIIEMSDRWREAS